jgi:hypothetical protein
LTSLATVALTSGLFAGLVAIGVTMAIERWGGVVGGFLGTLPTTIVPAAIGIAAGSPVDAMQASLHVVPAGMFLNAGFLFLWRAIPPHLPSWNLTARLAAMLIISLSLWLVAAVGMVSTIRWVHSTTMPLELFGVLTTLALVVVGLLACLRRPPAPRGSRRVGWLTLSARGILAACSIAFAVWLAAVGGSLAAGIAAVFPAIFLTTMASLWLSQGQAVPAGAVGPMMLGSTSVATYALIAARTLPWLGPWLGSAVAWLGAALGVTLPATLWLTKRSRYPALER